MRELFLQPLYDRALEGLPLVGTPAETAARFMNKPGSLQERVEALATTHVMLCSTTGFVCGLGGLFTLPITLPTNVAGVALLHLHLCASIAILAGKDPFDEKTRNLCIACLNANPDLGDDTREVVDRSAVKVAERGLRLVAETAIGVIDWAGKTTAKHLIGRQLPRRSLPLLGGLIGGISDLKATQRVLRSAKLAFAQEPAGLLTAQPEADDRSAGQDNDSDGSKSDDAS